MTDTNKIREEFLGFFKARDAGHKMAVRAGCQS